MENLKKLLGSDFPEIQRIDAQKPDYKSLSFTQKEISDFKKKLEEVATEQAKNLSAKLVKGTELKICRNWQFYIFPFLKPSQRGMSIINFLLSTQQKIYYYLDLQKYDSPTKNTFQTFFCSLHTLKKG